MLSAKTATSKMDSLPSDAETAALMIPHLSSHDEHCDDNDSDEDDGDDDNDGSDDNDGDDDGKALITVVVETFMRVIIAWKT
ncbi:hypothetical protein FHG87_007161 [Trinorchestia longiramus]|nr:hypothetical protein FHG87_007161 [Trinorchestia longiramus]